jgi:hypothetical protein
MKNGMILAKKKTWRSRLDLEYLDETSERKIEQRERLSPKSAIGQKLKQFGDYASKESLGQVHAGGFLHHLIVESPDGSRTAPSQMTNVERKKRISEAWFAHFRKFPSSAKEPVIQHRLVFSMSKELHDKLISSGINPDRVLQSTLKKVMTQFADRFHPADAIGYAYGLHHDTDNLHIHVALCPRTQRGAYVGCSTTRSHTSGHKDQMGYLRLCFERENLRWAEILSSTEKMEKRLSQRLDSDKIVFAPKLTRFQLEALRNSQTAEAIRLQQLYQSIRNLESAIAVKRQYRAAQRNSQLVFRLLGRRKPKFERTIEKLSRDIDQRSLREMQNLLFRIKKDYRTAHKRYTQLHGFNGHASRITQSVTHRQTLQKL